MTEASDARESADSVVCMGSVACAGGGRCAILADPNESERQKAEVLNDENKLFTDTSASGDLCHAMLGRPICRLTYVRKANMRNLQA